MAPAVHPLTLPGISKGIDPTNQARECKQRTAMALLAFPVTRRFRLSTLFFVRPFGSDLAASGRAGDPYLPNFKNIIMESIPMNHFNKGGEVNTFPMIRMNFKKGLCNFLFDGNHDDDLKFLYKWNELL